MVISNCQNTEHFIKKTDWSSTWRDSIQKNNLTSLPDLKNGRFYSEEKDLDVIRHDRSRTTTTGKKDVAPSPTSNNSTRPDLFTRLINEGRFIAGDDDDLVPLEDIPWIDKSLINESINFHHKYFALVILSNTSNLMYGFAIKPNTAVLLRTGKLLDPELSFHRYLSTVQRIGNFFAFPFNMQEAYKAFTVVRRMHAQASKKFGVAPTAKELKLEERWKKELVQAIRKDLAYIDTSSAPTHALTWDPPLPVSQFDMAVTQFGFWGSLWLFHKVFGIKDREREMRGVIHVWAIFGRLLGIRDEFNICLQPDPQLYEKLYMNVIVASLKTVDETVITVQSAFMTAFSKRMPLVTYKSLMFLGFQQFEDFKGDHLWKLMSWRDKACLKVSQGSLWMMKSSGVFRAVVNLFFALWLYVQFMLHLPRSSWPSPQYIFNRRMQ